MAHDTRSWLARIAISMALAVGLVISTSAVTPAFAGSSATTYSGQATFYEAAAGRTTNGNCSLPKLPANNLYVALGPAQYAAGAKCGSYLDVTGPKGTVRVIVMDKCPECGSGHLDLSKTAFAKIANVRDGLVPITYKTVVNPPVPAMSFRFKDGSSQWWFALQVIDHGNALASVEVRLNSKWVKTKRVDYGYWIYEPGAGPGPYRVRITDIYGHSVESSALSMKPMVVQQTTKRLYPK